MDKQTLEQMEEDVSTLEKFPVEVRLIMVMRTVNSFLSLPDSERTHERLMQLSIEMCLVGTSLVHIDWKTMMEHREAIILKEAEEYNEKTLETVNNILNNKSDNNG